MAERLIQKLAKQDAASQHSTTAEGGHENVNNPEIEKKIADFRASHPRHVDYLKGLTRERLENIATLRDIDRAEQRQRIRGATVRKLEDWLKTRPEEAQRITDAVAKLPQDNQAAARARMIQNSIQNEAFRNTQGTGGPKL